MRSTGKISAACTEYMINGVTISPSIPAAGENIKVIYDGILSKNGASDILVHVGFGENWDNTCDYSMSKTVTAFEASIPVEDSDVLNICFKDCANNWDNNSGKNYSFDISK